MWPIFTAKIPLKTKMSQLLTTARRTLKISMQQNSIAANWKFIQTIVYLNAKIPRLINIENYTHKIREWEPWARNIV